ncbi:MAG TPA: hypothetical protein VMF08_00235, partial [Candidatus Sulfotelmatobacter sp.]|nr:hypothetical protein [Candidatus Sulfotelmatobacter sp.]
MCAIGRARDREGHVPSFALPDSRPSRDQRATALTIQRFNLLTSKMRLPEWKRNKFVDFIGLKAIFGLVSITSLNVNLLTPTQMSDFA